MGIPADDTGLQHALNNPLAGLLAELQLLELDPLAPHQRAGVQRAIGLCHRLVGLVRERIPPSQL